VVGPSKQDPSKHTYIHTHVCNEVMLVWCLLRLTPIIPMDVDVINGYHQLK